MYRESHQMSAEPEKLTGDQISRRQRIRHARMTHADVVAVSTRAPARMLALLMSVRCKEGEAGMQRWTDAGRKGNRRRETDAMAYGWGTKGKGGKERVNIHDSQRLGLSEWQLKPLSPPRRSPRLLLVAQGRGEAMPLTAPGGIARAASRREETIR